MKNLIIFDYKKLIKRLFRLRDLSGKNRIHEREREGIPTNGELRRLITELRAINQKMAEMNDRCCPLQDLKVENINLDKVIFESLAFNMGNIDIDDLSGTMNIGLTVSLSGGIPKVSSLEFPGGDLSGNNHGTAKTCGINGDKKAAYRISFNPSKSSGEIKPQINRIK